MVTIEEKELRIIKRSRNRKSKKPQKMWTNEEIEYINSKKYNSYAEAAKYLNRSISSVTGKLNSLNIYFYKGYNKLDTKFIKDNFNKMKLIDIANKLNRSVVSIRERARRLGLTRNNLWKNTEIQFLKDNYVKYGIKYCSKKLTKSYFAITKKASSLGLTIKSITYISKEYIEQKYLIEKLSASDISKISNYSINQIYDAIHRYKIPIQPKSNFKNKKITKYYNNIPFYKYNEIKKSAKNRGIDFTISIEYLDYIFEKQKRRCYYTDDIIIFGKSNIKNSNSASLDRIDSSKGYIEGNVQWVHKYINHMKWQLSDDEFINNCIKVVLKHRKCIYDNCTN